MWKGYPEIQHELALVDELINRSISSRNKLLTEVVRDVVSSGGKRLRPALVIISAKFGDYERNKVLPMAGALEILHTATLIHDDIIDRSKVRRGKETVSEKYGPDMAVYTGDYLFTKAIMLLSKDVSIENLEFVAKAIKTICEGEVDQYQARYNIDTSIYSYLKRINRKTAVLFAAACSLGAYIVGCDDNITKKLARFGICYGTAFQIRDDLNDFICDQASSGKPVIKDIVEGVITLPVIFSMRRNKAIRDALSYFTRNKDKTSLDELQELALAIRDSGGVKDAGKLLDKYIEKGISALEPLPDNEYKSLLVKLIKSLAI